MVKLGANLGLLKFAAFLRRAAAPWPTVAALESRDSEFLDSRIYRHQVRKKNKIFVVNFI